MKTLLTALFLAVASLASAQDAVDPYITALQDQSPEAFAAFQTATLGHPMVVDLSQTVVGGRITARIEESIEASSSITVEAWTAQLAAAWPSVMARIAKALKAGNYTVLGVYDGERAGVQHTYGCCRGMALLFTRAETTITAQVVILAGK
jgi:hypothetical protein